MRTSLEQQFLARSSAAGGSDLDQAAAKRDGDLHWLAGTRYPARAYDSLTLKPVNLEIPPRLATRRPRKRPEPADNLPRR